ncbi:hypothetical protein [Brevibacillus borstelensis]|uniref:hypothetical protein n=1 Tax=Brevibacillus borstelensis TaxID=45462 RepID=UPI0030BEDCAE
MYTQRSGRYFPITAKGIDSVSPSQGVFVLLACGNLAIPFSLNEIDCQTSLSGSGIIDRIFSVIPDGHVSLHKKREGYPPSLFLERHDFTRISKSENRLARLGLGDDVPVADRVTDGGLAANRTSISVISHVYAAIFPAMPGSYLPFSM